MGFLERKHVLKHEETDKIIYEGRSSYQKQCRKHIYPTICPILSDQSLVNSVKLLNGGDMELP